MAKTYKRPANRALKKQIKSLKKEGTKIKSKTSKLDVELKKLKDGLEKLKGKGVKKKQLSRYNLFIRDQLKKGRTFVQAVRLWKRAEKATRVLRKKPSTKSKTVKPKSVPKKKSAGHKTAKKAKSSKAKTKPARKKITKKVIRKVKVPTVITKFKPRIIEKDVLSKEKIDQIVSRLDEKQKSMIDSIMLQMKYPKQAMVSESAVVPSDEEIAIKLTRLYFREIAQLGFKRGLELDAIINAYLYSLARVQRMGFESQEIIDAIRKSEISRKAF